MRGVESNRSGVGGKGRCRTRFQLMVAAQSGMPDNPILKSTSFAILAALLD